MKIRKWHFFVVCAIVQYGVSTYQFYLHFFRAAPYPTRLSPYGWLAMPAMFTAFAVNFYKANLCAVRRECGLCDRCGYDLRATAGRCPECGEIPMTALEANLEPQALK